ncbi:MAG: hypothetical protein AAGD10_04780 [Myxococcota bacterium]
MVRSLSLLPSALLVLAACGGDEPSDEPDPNPPSGEGAQVDIVDPCAPNAPSPNNFFALPDGTSEVDGCPLQSSGVDAAVERLTRTDGAPINARVSVPVSVDVEPQSLSSTVTFDLDQMGQGTGVPASVLVAWTGSSTTPESFVEVEDVVTTFESGSVVVDPAADLAFGQRHYTVLTRAITDREDTPLGATAEVRALLGIDSVESLGLEAAVEARIRRERDRLVPLLAALAVASPPIGPEDIVSVHSFDTTQGPERLQRLGERVFELIDTGSVPFNITVDDAILTPAELSPAVNNAQFPDVGRVIKGRLDVLNVLSEGLRIRPDWDQDVQVRPLRFTMTLPVDDSNVQGLALILPGYGRGLNDVLALAQQAAAQRFATVAFSVRCHGPRSPDGDGLCGEQRSDAELEALDAGPNSDDERVAGPDGIPDDSGIAFFPGDAGALRDTQLAAALELLHVFSYFRDRSEQFQPAVGASFSASRIRLGVHGHVGQVATAALSIYAVAERRSPVQTVTLVQAGAGYRELVLNGPAELRQAFLDTTPDDVTTDNVAQYLGRLESQVLQSLDIERNAPLAGELFTNSIGRLERARSITQGQPQTTSTTALRDMERAWAFPDSLSPQLMGLVEACDEFLFFPCGGFDAEATDQARALVIQAP